MSSRSPIASLRSNDRKAFVKLENTIGEYAQALSLQPQNPELAQDISVLVSYRDMMRDRRTRVFGEHDTRMNPDPVSRTAELYAGMQPYREDMNILRKRIITLNNRYPSIDTDAFDDAFRMVKLAFETYAQAAAPGNGQGTTQNGRR